MPDRDDLDPEPRSDVPGLDGPLTSGLERFAIRTRESAVTRAGWRLPVESRDGAGAITLVEISPAQSVYRGEGIFLGWPQDRLAAAYAALCPPDDEPPVEIPQLG